MTSLVRVLASIAVVACLACDLVRGDACPDKCSCSSHLKVISCRNRGLTKVPANIPMSATRLDLYGNKLTSLNDTFIALPNLTMLNVEHNKIRQIQPLAFNGTQKLNLLYLSNNNIAMLNATVFKGLKSLDKVYLANNNLTTIPDFRYALNLTTLNVDNNKIKTMSFPKGFSSLKMLKSVTLSHNPVTSLSTADFAALSNSPITTVNLNNCQIKSVENGTFAVFRSLSSLNMGYNQLNVSLTRAIIESLVKSPMTSLDFSKSLDTLPVDIFRPLAKAPMNSLKLKENDLQVIENGAFEPLPHLVHLDLSGSTIYVILNGAFAPLKKLQTLYLDRCGLGLMPSPLPASLKTLTMSSNRLPEVPSQSFPLNSSLVKIDMSLNSLRIIHKDSFSNLQQLTSLDLSHNLLAGSSIAKDSLVDLVNLGELNLNDNRLTSIPTNSRMFYGLKALKTLWMSSNGCSRLATGIFDPLTSLQVLHLEDNSLDSQLNNASSTPLFLKLARLQELYLDHNDLQQLSSRSFQGAISLNKLQLSDNRVAHWQHDTFKSLQNLTSLDLSVNLISVLNISSVDHFPSNMSLNLANNPFNCWCDLIPFRRWINTTDVKLVDLQAYQCTSPDSQKNKALLDFDPEAIEKECHPPYLMYALIAAGVTLVIAIVLGIVLYRLRWRILLWWYNVRKRYCRSSNTEAPLLEQGAFSVTISYGPDDESTRRVHSQLLPQVEQYMTDVFADGRDVQLGTGYSRQIGRAPASIRILVCTKQHVCENVQEFRS